MAPAQTDFRYSKKVPLQAAKRKISEETEGKFHFRIRNPSIFEITVQKKLILKQEYLGHFIDFIPTNQGKAER